MYILIFSMPVKVKCRDNAFDRWVDAYIRKITFGNKHITIEINYTGSWTTHVVSLAEFKEEYKFTGKRIVSSVPMGF